MDGHRPRARRVESSASTQVSQLRLRQLGSSRVRPVAACRQPPMEDNRAMILAAEIGATRTRLAAFETEGNRLKCVVEKTYPSQKHEGMAGILADFIKT